MPVQTLNARAVEGLKPSNKRVDYFDKDLPGFHVRVTPNGVKTFSIMYRHGGRLRRMKIGTHPPLTLADARETAREELRKAAKGEDPAAEKKRKREAETFGELADEFIERYAKVKKKSWREDKRILDVHFLPAFRHIKAAEVHRADVRAIVEKMAEETPVQANRALAVIRKLYNWAIEKDIVENNPCFRISAPGEEHQRDRILSEEEIKKLWKALNEDGTQLAASMKLRLITAQRGGEVASLKWDEIDFASRWWTIPAEKSKNGLSHRVWLSNPALQILRDLSRVRDESDRLKVSAFVFPNPRDGSRPMCELQKAIQRIRTASGIQDFNGHDLRRTAASMMASMGVPRLVIQKILNHVETGITSVYDRHSYDAEKKDALDKWAKRLARIVSNLKAASATQT
jgi:integrase